MAKETNLRLDDPQLVWEGPDEDGDLIVRLVNLPGWGPMGIVAHGKTQNAALFLLGCVLHDHLGDCEICGNAQVSR